MLPLIKLKPFYPAQWGIPGADTPLGLRTLPGAMVFYVQSTHTNANNSNDGTDPDYPLATIDAAIGKCTANRGDEIHVGETHAESIATAAAINLDIAGVKIIGHGTGQARPRISYTNIAATVAVASANCTIANILFLVGVDSLPIMVDVNADDFSLVGCEFRENTAVAQQWLTAVDINGGGANAADRTKIVGCKFESEAAGATQAIEIGAVQDGIEIRDCFITGDFSVAGIHSASACTNMLLANNFIRNVNAGDFAVELSAAATGMSVNNRFYADAVATTFDPGSLMCIGDQYVNAADSWTNPVGENNADNAFDSTAVVANANGSVLERLESLQSIGLQSRCVEKANGEVLAGPDDLFTVAGGPIIVDAIFGLCATAPGGASNCHLDMAVTDPAATIAMSTDVAIDAIIAGGTISFTDVALPVLTITAAGSLIDPAASGHYYLTPGTIQAHCSVARAAAVIRWFCLYRPLSANSTVTAAA